jgi:DNA-binding transcriptional regulator LsrR (DeoR family)
MAAKYQSLRQRVRVPYSQSPSLQKDREKAERLARKADFVFLGVGPWKQKFTALEFVHHLGHDPSELRRRYQNVRAVCGYHAIDDDGKYIPLRVISKVMPHALPFGGLLKLAKKRTVRVVLLARSKAKATAVLCAIRARIANTLIVDEDIAISLLNDLAVSTDFADGNAVLKNAT